MTQVRSTEIDWDEIYSTGAHLDNWEHADVDPAVATFVASRTWQADARAIDIGCGTGADACHLALAGFDVTGIDLSETALVEARARSARLALGVDWVVGTACALPVDDGSISLALDGSCAHHFASDEWDAFELELARILIPGGVFFLRGVSDRYREQCCLREADVRARFDHGHFRVVELAHVELRRVTRSAPGLQAVIERR